VAGVAPVVELAGLSRDAIAGLVREAWPEASESGAARIAERSEGVPLFALEMARTPGQEVPAAIRELVTARLGSLGRDERAILDAAAVHGSEFDADLVASALGRPAVEVLQALAEIERKLGLVRAAGRHYRFEYRQVRDVLYDELPERLREEYHTRLAEAEDAPRSKAWHHLHGREPARGLPFLSDALDYLEQRYMNEQALALVDRALDLVDEQERVSLLLRKSLRLNVLGRRVPQRETATEALARANEFDDARLRCRAHQALGMVDAATNRTPDALGHFRNARDLAREAGDRALEVRALTNHGQQLARLGRPDEARIEHERARALAEQDGDTFAQAAAIANIAGVLENQHRYKEALALFEESLSLTGDAQQQAYYGGRVGLALWHLGRFEEATPHIERQLELACRIGDRRAEAAATGNLGLVARDRGRVADALDHTRRQAAISVEIDDRRGWAISRINESELLYHMGDRVEAGRLASETAFEMRRLGDRTLEAHGLTGRGLAGIDPEGSCRAALAQFRKLSGRGGEADALVALGRLGLASGDELTTAAEIGAELRVPAWRLLGLALKGDVAGARRELPAAGPRTGHFQMLDVRYALWKADGSADDLAEAKRLLDEACRHAPARYRESILEDVPAYRAIHETE